MKLSTNKQITLNDGRVLAYAEYGSSAGRPLMYFHGFPGCRREAALADDVAAGLDVRILAVDRPGMGRSSYKTDRRIGDWPNDIVELANSLGLDRFSVLGVSGGGPYAAACASKIPERLTAVGIVCGLGPTHPPGATLGMPSLNRLAFPLARHASWLVRPCYAALSRFVLHHPRRLLARLLHSAGPADRATLMREEVLDTLLHSLREAGGQGGRGVARDLFLFAQPWDFALKHIATRLHLWHGKADRIVPCSMGRHLAAAVPDCVARFYPGEGHFSLPLNHMETVLRTLTA